MERLSQKADVRRDPRAAFARHHDHPNMRKPLPREAGHIAAGAVAGEPEVRHEQAEFRAHARDDEFGRLGAFTLNDVHAFVLQKFAQDFALEFVVFDAKSYSIKSIAYADI